jgi:hypothetical protein
MEEDSNDPMLYMDILLSQRDIQNIVDGKGAECAFMGELLGDRNLSFFIRKDPETT